MKPVYICTFLLLTISLCGTAQNRLYVNHLAAGANSGQSWADAYSNLQTALQAAQPGDEIWIAEGEYKTTTGTDRSLSFEMKSGVRLYGGFDGTETELLQRDWQAHPVVLSGDIGASGDSTDNSYNILYIENPDINTLLDGLIFRYGQADNLNTVNFGDRGNSGAALYIMAYDDEAYPDIRHCVFERNYAYGSGGAVYVNGAGGGSVAPRFMECTFRNNHARRDGGAVYRDGGSWQERSPDFGACRFEGNRAQRNGGGLLWRDSDGLDTMHIIACEFIGNTAVSNGGGFDLQTGRSDGSRFVIDSCLIEKNRAKNGSGSRLWYKALFQPCVYARIANSKWVENGDSTSFYTIFSSLFPPDGDGGLMLTENCIFNENESRGVMFLLGDLDTITILGSTFMSNRLWYDSLTSSLPFFSSVKNLQNCLFRYNQSLIFPFQISGVGAESNYFNNIFINNINLHHAYFYTAKIPLNLYNNKLNHCSFIGNNSKPPLVPGPGLGRIQYQNCAFYGEANPALLFDSYTSVALRHCYFDSLDCGSLPGVSCDDGMVIGGDPLFVNPDSGDFRLSPCSPLRNAGLNISTDTIPYDFEGKPRILEGVADIGAYETPAFGLASEPSVAAACADQPTGAVTVPLQSACEPLSAQWQSGAQSGTGLGGLAAGQYLFTVTDAQGRSVVFGASIPAAAAPMLQVDGAPVSCYGAADAMLSVMPLTGKPPFSYLWSPSGATDSVSAGLGPGPVSVTVTDAWGCTSTFAFDVPEPDTLQFTATVTDASTAQSSDGGILVNVVTGGTAPYDYLWSPGGSSASLLENIPPGIYTLTVTDERGCEAVQTFEVKYVLDAGDALTGGMLLLYPNPAGETVTLSADIGPGATLSLLEIYDSGGRLLRRLALPNPGAGVWEVSLEGQAAGWYPIRLLDGKGKVAASGSLIKR